MAGSIPSPPSPVAVAGTSGAIDFFNGLAACLDALVPAVQGLPDLLWGSVTLVAGQAVVSCGQIASPSLVYTARQGVAGTPGHLSIEAIVPGVSFTIVSSSSSDASAVAYLIIP